MLNISDSAHCTDTVTGLTEYHPKQHAPDCKQIIFLCAHIPIEITVGAITSWF